MPSFTYLEDGRYDGLVEALMDCEPDPVHGFVTHCQVKIALAEFGVFPMRMAIPIIEDEARDREVELRRGYRDRPTNNAATCAEMDRHLADTEANLAAFLDDLASAV